MNGARLLRFLAQRLGKSVVVIFAIVVVNFLLIHAAPGDPASVIAGESGMADQKFVEQLRHQFGLDRPLPEQLWIYVSSVAQGDLGFSYRQQRPVSALIEERLPATLLLTITAFAFAVASGVLMGCWRRVMWGPLRTRLSL
jgi:peptide/nickel transport system permease protein